MHTVVGGIGIFIPATSMVPLISQDSPAGCAAEAGTAAHAVIAVASTTADCLFMTVLLVE